MGTSWSKSFLKKKKNGNADVMKHAPKELELPKPEDIGNNLLGFLVAEPKWKSAKEAGRNAFVDAATGDAVTYAELEEAIRGVAAALKAELGDAAGPEATVAIVAPNSHNYAVVWLAAAAIGIRVTMVNPAYTAEEMAAQFKDAGASIVFAWSQLIERVREGMGDAVTVHDIQEYVSAHATPEGSNDDGKWVKEMDVKEDVLALPYSSGTSGKPKGVMLTHWNILTNIVQISHGDNLSAVEEGSVVLGVLPFYHIYGMIVVMLSSLVCGGTVVTMPKFDPTMFLSALDTYKVTNAFLAPPLMGFLAKHPAVDASKIHIVDIVCGAAPLGADLANAVKQKLPSLKSCRQGYGMTELSPVSHIGPFGNEKYGAVGTMIPNIECKLAEGTDELCVRGPNVMKGYLNNEEATKECIDADGFMHTGDVARVDEEGYFYIIDRLKELIKVKGFQVAPAEIEAILMTHEGVLDAAVIGVSATSVGGRETDGEAVAAYVVLKDKENAAGLTDEQVIEFAAEKAASYKRIARVKFVEAIPKSAAGKILRKEIRAGKLD